MERGLTVLVLIQSQFPLNIPELPEIFFSKGMNFAFYSNKTWFQ